MSSLLPLITDSADSLISQAVVFFVSGIAGGTMALALTRNFRTVSRYPVAGLALSAILLFVFLLLSDSITPGKSLPFEVTNPETGSYLALILLVLSVLAYFAYAKGKGIMHDAILDGIILTTAASAPFALIVLTIITTKGFDALSPAVVSCSHALGVSVPVMIIQKFSAEDKEGHYPVSTLWWAVTVIYGMFLFAGFSIPSPAASSVAENPVEQAGSLPVHRNTLDAYEKARQSGKLVFIDFYADWCKPCKEFSARLQTDDELQNRLNRFVVLKVKEQDPVFRLFEQSSGFEQLKTGLPLFVITSPDGDVIAAAAGLQELEVMLDNRAPVAAD